MSDNCRALDYLYMNWLRPEGVVWDCVASQLFRSELINDSGSILEIGIGNGYTSFMQLGGAFDPSYDWYYNVLLQGFDENADIYDASVIDSVSSFIRKQPEVRIDYAIDHKQNLLDQVSQLNFVNKLSVHDANLPLYLLKILLIQLHLISFTG